MSNALCRQAIETQLSAWAAARSPALPVAWENVEFPSPPATYLRAFLLPAKTTGIDLAGVGRTYIGIYQVSVITPVDIGPGTAEGIASEIAALFPLNLRLAVSGMTLQVISPVTCAQGAQDGFSYIVPVSFGYRADTI